MLFKSGTSSKPTNLNIRWIKINYTSIMIPFKWLNKIVGAIENRRLIVGKRQIKSSQY